MVAGWDTLEPMAGLEIAVSATTQDGTVAAGSRRGAPVWRRLLCLLLAGFLFAVAPGLVPDALAHGVSGHQATQAEPARSAAPSAVPSAGETVVAAAHGGADEAAHGMCCHEGGRGVACQSVTFGASWAGFFYLPQSRAVRFFAGGAPSAGVSHRPPTPPPDTGL